MPLDVIARLDHEHRPVIESLPAAFGPGDVEDVRQRLAAMARAVPPRPLPESVVLSIHQIASQGGEPLELRVFSRRDSDEESQPAMLWIHGGGFIHGSASMDDAYCASLVKHLGIRVIAVDYRLAPEHRFPAPLHDCQDALSWIVDNASTIGADTDRLIVGGGSAGGGLAAALCLWARDNGGPRIHFQFLIYPMLDDRRHPAQPEIVDDRVWNRTTNEMAWRAYLGDEPGGDDVDPLAAPARIDDLTGLPPTYLAVGELDLFISEDLDYAARLIACGVPTELHAYPGAFHGSNAIVPFSALSRRWARDERDALRAAIDD